MTSANDQQSSSSMLCGLRAPSHIYSCVIRNQTGEELKVTVEYRGLDKKHTEIMDVEIAKGEDQRINEKTFEHEDESALHGRKTIHLIKVKKFDGKEMELREPFEGVTSPQQDWEFHIYDNQIKSVKPTTK